MSNDLPSRPPPKDNRSAFERSIMAIAQGPGDLAARKIDLEINKWFMRRYGRLPPAREMQEHITLVSATHEHGTVFAWHGKCVFEFRVSRDGDVWAVEVPEDFVEIIQKNTLT